MRCAVAGVLPAWTAFALGNLQQTARKRWELCHGRHV